MRFIPLSNINIKIRSRAVVLSLSLLPFPLLRETRSASMYYPLKIEEDFKNRKSEQDLIQEEAHRKQKVAQERSANKKAQEKCVTLKKAQDQGRLEALLKDTDKESQEEINRILNQAVKNINKDITYCELIIKLLKKGIFKDLSALTDEQIFHLITYGKELDKQLLEMPIMKEQLKRYGKMLGNLASSQNNWLLWAYLLHNKYDGSGATNDTWIYIQEKAKQEKDKKTLKYLKKTNHPGKASKNTSSPLVSDKKSSASPKSGASATMINTTSLVMSTAAILVGATQMVRNKTNSKKKKTVNN